MRFTTAWAAVSSQNNVLRLVVLMLLGLLVLMSLMAAKALLRPPLIIERSCYSSVLSPKTVAATPIEVEGFVREALRQRFDSDAVPNADFFSVDEFRQRGKEQEELAQRQMKQRVLVNVMTRQDDTITVDADRLISIGTIRSAFPFPLILTMGSVARSEANPYGLVLLKISQQKQETVNEK